MDCIVSLITYYVCYICMNQWQGRERNIKKTLKPTTLFHLTIRTSESQLFEIIVFRIQVIASKINALRFISQWNPIWNNKDLPKHCNITTHKLQATLFALGISTTLFNSHNCFLKITEHRNLYKYVRLIWYNNTPLYSNNTYDIVTNSSPLVPPVISWYPVR